MDLTFDHHGNMLGVTTTVNPSGVPAILYRIDPATGKATKLFNLVGSNYVMGLAFGRDGKLYATDDFENPGLYRIGTRTGLETAIAALPFGFSSGLELMDSGGSGNWHRPASWSVHTCQAFSIVRIGQASGDHASLPVRTSSPA